MRVKGAKKRVAIALAAALVVSGIGYVPKADAESVTQVTGDYSQEVNEVCDTMEFVVSTRYLVPWAANGPLWYWDVPAA